MDRSERSPRTGRSLRDSREFMDMAEAVKHRLAGRTAAFFTNPGNRGDALIDAGTAAFPQAHAIPHARYNSRHLRDLHRTHYKPAFIKHQFLSIVSGGRHVRYPLRLRSIAETHDVAIICGSGGFARQSQVAKQIFELCLDRFADVIVLPSTYALSPRTGAHAMLFARDRFGSLDFVPGAIFCHDLAFYLSPDPITPDRAVGYHIRRDCESTGSLPIPPANVDISAEGTEFAPIDRFLEAVGRSEIIITDRLHVAIAGALLDRRVYLFRGSYFKIEAIYKSSVEPNYPNVTLLDEWDQLPPTLR
jgi:hypothetical protein